MLPQPCYVPGMVTRIVQVTLEASDGSTTVEQGTLQEFSEFDRFRRAAIIFGVAVLMAAMLIPVPIIHLLGIPLVLVIGIVLAVRQLRLSCRLTPMKIKCPRCHESNRLGGGLGLRSATEPFERQCEDCRRPLTVRISAP